MVPIEEIIDEAETKILTRYEFLGSFLVRVKKRIVNTIPTCMTDGKIIAINEKYFRKLSSNERIAVLLHEICHIIFFHLHKRRIEGKNLLIWNLACDYETNCILKENNVSFPNWLYDEKFEGLIAEEIYQKLLKEGQNQAQKSKTNFDSQDFEDNGQYTEEIQDMKSRGFDIHVPIDEENEKETLEELSRFYSFLKSIGKIPAGFQRILKKLYEPKIPWYELLRRFIDTVINQEDYHFLKPNRKSVWREIVLPSLRQERLENIHVAIDTSGSILPDEIASFASEVKGILNESEEITVLTCDAKVHEKIKVSNISDFLEKIKFKGGGGTDFNPVFENIEKDKDDVSVLIFLTDGYGKYPAKSPNYSVVWVLSKVEDTQRPIPPFGEVIILDSYNGLFK